MKPPACRTGRQRGAVIITVCLTLVFLLGFMGFALDLGRLFIVKHELQTALDSCALAAAQELDGQPTAIARAVSAGQSAGNANRVNLQSANWDGKGQLTAASFQFFDASLTPTTTPDLARYVECSHTQPAVRLWLLQAMNAFLGEAQAGPATQNVGARAVATRTSAQTTCPVPLMLRPKVTGAGAPDYGYTRGDWVKLLADPAGATSNFVGWANLDGTSSASSTESELLRGYCDVRLDVPLGTPGVQNAIADAWNARFGIYRNQGSPSQPFMQPDMTGYAYSTANWPSGRAAYDGPVPPGAHPTAANFETKRASFASCADTGTQVTGANSCSTISQRPIGGGFNKLAEPGAGADGHWKYGVNKRLVIVPVSTTYPGKVEDYACMLILQPMTIPMTDVALEFIGNAGAIDSPCTTNGIPGGTAGPQVPVLVR